MQIIYNCTFQTNHFSTVYIVAGILLLQFMAHVVLFPLLNVLYIIIIIIIIIKMKFAWAFLLLCDCFIGIKLILPCDLSLSGFMLFVDVCWSVSILYSGKPQWRQWLLFWCIDCTLSRKRCLKFCYTCCISSCWLKVQYRNCWMK